MKIADIALADEPPPAQASDIAAPHPSPFPGPVPGKASAAPLAGLSVPIKPLSATKVVDAPTLPPASAMNAAQVAASPASRLGSIGLGRAAPVAPAPELLDDVRNIPKGRFEPFAALDMPSSFENGFALFMRSDGTGTLLVDPDMWGKPLHMEAANRIKGRQPDLTLVNQRATQEVIRALHRQNADAAVKRLETHTDIEKFAWKLIDDAVNSHASDIHIETRGAFAQVFFRIFGERVEQATIATDSALALCNVLYGFHADSSSKKTNWTPSEVMDTSIEHSTADGLTVQIRFASAPIHPSPNFHVVCRLLIMDVSLTPTLADIGYTTGQRTAVEDMLVGSQGLVVLVGPTNSGKSTSMQAFAQQVRKRRGESIKIITVEDPVEYLIDGACQMGVSHGRKQLEGRDGSVYNTLLKGTLRQDPDVVIVGEIRDAESCSAVKDLVLAGRKLLTTLHVYEAMAVYSRLRELGVPESILFMNNFISGVIYQRLVPTLCPHCSVPLEDAHRQGHVNPTVYQRVTTAVSLEGSNVRVRKPGGCEHCGGRGIVGRTACAEMIVPDEIFLSYMRKGDLAGARSYWSTNSQLNVDGFGVSAVGHAICKMVAGMIDPHDVESQIGMIKVEHHGSGMQGVQVAYLDGGGADMGSAHLSRRGMGDRPTNRMAHVYGTGGR